MSLTVSQSRRQIQNLGGVFATESLFHAGKPVSFCCLTAGREGRVGCNHQAHAVRVIQQQPLDQSGNVIGVCYARAQRGNHRLQIKRGHRIAVVGRGAQGSEHQVQAIGHAITADFALVQFDLSKNGFHFIGRDAFCHHLFNTRQYL